MNKSWYEVEKRTKQGNDLNVYNKYMLNLWRGEYLFDTLMLVLWKSSPQIKIFNICTDKISQNKFRDLFFININSIFL